MNPKRERRLAAVREAETTFEQYVTDLAQRCKLESWNQFVDEIKVPAELLPGMMANRPELVKIAPARDMTAAEVKVLYGVIAGLMATNAALREHSQQVSQLVDNWHGTFKAANSIAKKVHAFANFRHDDAAAADDEEQT